MTLAQSSVSVKLRKFSLRSWYPKPNILGEINQTPVIAAYRAGDDFHVLVPCPFCPPSRNRKRKFSVHVHGEPQQGEKFTRMSHCPRGPRQIHLAIVGDFPWQRVEGVQQ